MIWFQTTLNLNKFCQKKVSQHFLYQEFDFTNFIVEMFWVWYYWNERKLNWETTKIHIFSWITIILKTSLWVWRKNIFVVFDHPHRSHILALSWRLGQKNRSRIVSQFWAFLRSCLCSMRYLTHIVLFFLTG